MEENYTKLNFTDKLYIVIIELEKIKRYKRNKKQRIIKLV